jgi:multisubunit Na+/H+ antiporter MnhE subunit
VRVRPLGVVRLIASLLVQQVPSNVLVTREMLRRRPGAHTGVIAHPVEQASGPLLALIANSIALTPGTLTVEVTPDPAVVYVHFLRLDDPDQARATIAQLEARCRAALAGPTRPSSHEPEGPS